MKPNDPLDDFQPPDGPPRHPVRFWWIVLSIVLLALLILLLLIRVNTPEAGSVLGYQPTPGFTGGKLIRFSGSTNITSVRRTRSWKPAGPRPRRAR
jgi:hypothetical protein